MTDRSPQEARSWRKRLTDKESRLQRHPAFFASAAFGLLVVAAGGGCSFGESGIAPPTNRIFLPGGVVADPEADFVYVVNSNSDLRFNAGTVVAVDIALAKLVRDCAEDPTAPACGTVSDPLLQSPRLMCTKTRFSRTEPVADNYCCVDMFDSNILNCNEPQFVQDDATIQIGSYGGPIQLQDFQRNGEAVRRIFVAVRAEPSITFADVTSLTDAAGTHVAMRCTGKHGAPAETLPKNAFCDENWRIRRPGGATPGALALPEEPHVLALDNQRQALFVGHLTVTDNSQVQGGGISAFDVCNPEQDYSSPVRFAGLAHNTFVPSTLSQAVAMLSMGSDPYPLPSPTVVYATSRYSTAVSGMVFLREPASDNADCNADAPRDLTLVPGDHFFSSAFLPNGNDVRGILFYQAKLPDGTKLPRAFVLHRNDADTVANPAGLVLLDRSPLPDGTFSDDPLAILQVCNGPTAMQMHNFGRGDRIFITCYDDGQIYVVDPDALTIAATVDVGVGPTSLVFSPRQPGIAYVASFVNSHLSLIDFRPGSPTENRVIMRIGLPHGFGE